MESQSASAHAVTWAAPQILPGSAEAEPVEFEDERPATLLVTAAVDSSPAVRAEALHAIGRIQSDTVNPALTHALNDHDARVRKAAIGAIEGSGAEDALAVLAIALEDRDASVRATAVDAIGEIGGEAARRLLEAALLDQNAVVREAASIELEQFVPAR